MTSPHLLHTPPGPADWDWQHRGSCRGTGTALFFSPDGERASARVHRERAAQQLCEQCPVITNCREHALTAGEPYGIWGGMTEADRTRHRRRGHRREIAESRPHGRAGRTHHLPAPNDHLPRRKAFR